MAVLATFSLAADYLLEAFADKTDPELKDDGRQRPLISDERG